MLFHLHRVHRRVSSTGEETSQREQDKTGLVLSEGGDKKRGQDRGEADLKSCIYNALGSAEYFLLLPRMFSASADIQV